MEDNFKIGDTVYGVASNHYFIIGTLKAIMDNDDPYFAYTIEPAWTVNSKGEKEYPYCWADIPEGCLAKTYEELEDLSKQLFEKQVNECIKNYKLDTDFDSFVHFPLTDYFCYDYSIEAYKRCINIYLKDKNK